ncbi:hypothetical protein A7M85_21100 [Acinetobacter baumannii]|nr:hypothetical protein A7M85_21100 [Acinetobacter baumannii]
MGSRVNPQPPCSVGRATVLRGTPVARIPLSKLWSEDPLAPEYLQHEEDKEASRHKREESKEPPYMDPKPQAPSQDHSQKSEVGQEHLEEGQSRSAEDHPAKAGQGMVGHPVDHKAHEAQKLHVGVSGPPGVGKEAQA